MTITKHAESHVDHSLTEAQLAFVLSHDPEKHGEGRIRVFTVDIPPELGTLPCALYGPVEGDDPVPESEVVYRYRTKAKRILMSGGCKPDMDSQILFLAKPLQMGLSHFKEALTPTSVCV